MKGLFTTDYYRMTGEHFKYNMKTLFVYLTRYDIRYLSHIRKKHDTIVNKLVLRRYSRKYGLEILSKKIGEGLYIGHPHNINVHPHAVIGKNCNLNKGCTIGRENRGKRNGAPTLGDNVWVGNYATVVGNVHIGDDVLIAPNAFVNFDVPDHSIVIGNPAIIKARRDATEGYVSNRV